MRSVVSLIFVLFVASAIAAQSGRRVGPTPTPIPEARSTSQDPALPYSESQPRPHSSRVVQTSGVIPVPQTPDGPPQTVGDTDVLKVETNLITIPVSVFDRNGLYIPGLKQDDFKIFENGKEQQVAYFGTQDEPFTVAILLDTSPSTQYKIDEIHAAARAFVDELSPRDSVIVIEFNSSVKVQCQRTTDRDKIYKGIERAQFGGGTSLYNAVDEALRKQLSKVEGRKAVVLFTDGVDTTSRKNSYDGTVGYAEESDALVFPIYFNTYDDNHTVASRSATGGIWGAILGGPPMLAVGTSAEEYALGKRYLDDLAGVTGGRLFRPESTPGGLQRAFEGIAEELRHQYNIGYIPDSEGKAGERKAIKVRVDRPNLVVRSRDSYIVGASKAQAQTPSK
jgi:Ca-activated chloride channel family protein